MNKITKFIANETDDKHCLQSCLRMTYHHFFNKELSIKESENVSGFETGKPTWPFAAMAFLAESGLFVINIEDFDLEAYLNDLPSAIYNQFGKAVGDTVIAITDVKKETKNIKTLSSHENFRFVRKTPNIEDLKKCVKGDDIAIVNINYWGLLGEDKYSGHFVIVEGIYDNKVILQNPGLPAIWNQEVDIDKFMSAWYYPDEKAGNIIAVSQSQKLLGHQ